MKTTVVGSAMCLFLAVGGTGCGDDTEMTASDANRLASLFVNVGLDALSSGMSQHGTQVNVQYSHTTQCPAQGRVSVSGSLTGGVSDKGTGQLWMQIQESLIDCGMRSGDHEFEFNGSLSLTGTFSFVGGQPSTPRST